jgi:hypothetical protein
MNQCRDLNDSEAGLTIMLNLGSEDLEVIQLA